ncbi:MAG: transketolase [Cytophagales bacterium]|nr:transketolase [Armatimonadota bacterium]
MSTATLDPPTQSADLTQEWKALAAQLRADSIRCTTAAGSGHPTSGMSAADLMAVLLKSHLHYDFDAPHKPNNDHLIFSKGHACPVLYALYKAAGAISDAELLTLRQFDSRLEGHPTPEIPYVDAATGSLGQGLPIGVGIAIAGKHLENLPYKVWVVLGDSEMAEGSIYEAFATAQHYGLDNVIAILDCNRLGQRGPTAIGWHTEFYAARAQAFGWHTIVIDGHDVRAIHDAYTEARAADKPVLIVAKTEKGHGVSFTADQPGWHGKAMKPDEQEKALVELGSPSGDLIVKPPLPEDLQPTPRPENREFVAPAYEMGTKYATRQAYGDALKALGAARGDVVVLDAEVGNSTFSETFLKEYPHRYFEIFIAEQMMISAAQGLTIRGSVAFAATFAAFLSRSYDQIRMAAVSRATLRLCGSHAGISIGEDGPSQMALEDLSMFRAVHGSAVLYPSDAVSTIHLIKAMAERDGVSYLRSTREKTAVLYGPDETFPIGGSKTVRYGDKATIIGAGITLHEAIKAADQLAGEGIPVRVIDLYSVKPVDTDTLAKAAQETGHLIVVEDHWAEGGLGDAVLAALAEKGVALAKFTHLAVREMPRSGKPEELLEKFGISASHIVEAVKAA